MDMSLLTFDADDGYFTLHERECRELGARLSREYREALPFPHIVLDDFIDRDILKLVDKAYPANEGRKFFDRDQERLKFQFQPRDTRSGLVQNLFSELNGRAFLAFLEELTGISGLVSDPYYEGGGLHETKRGGHLSIHADFNVHERLGLVRRLNLLIYLNEGWIEEWGGHLELWDTDVRACRVKVPPVLGRAVIFSTDESSYHGHPDPLACPPERSRRSLATYYYTAAKESLLGVPHHTTNFKARPGSSDKVDWKIKRLHFVENWVPRALQRYARRLL
jgi:hypothetical protein